MKRAYFKTTINEHKNNIMIDKPNQSKPKYFWIKNLKHILTTSLYIIILFHFNDLQSQSFCNIIGLNTSKTKNGSIYNNIVECANINSINLINTEFQKDFISRESVLLLIPSEEEEQNQGLSSKVNHNISLIYSGGATYNFNFVLLLGSLNYRYNHFLLSVDYFRFEKILDSQTYDIIGISAGTRFFSDKYFAIDTQLGFGAIRSNEINWNKTEITFNIKPGIKFIPIPYFAVGLGALICVNSMKNFYSYSLISFEIGIIQ